MKMFNLSVRWRLALILLHLSFGATGNSMLNRYSPLKSDEHLVFMNTDGVYDETEGVWRIPIHAWVFEPEVSLIRKRLVADIFERKYGLVVDDSTRKNFADRVNHFLADNEGGKQIRISIAGETFELPATESNGHSQHTIVLSEKKVAQYANGNVLSFRASLDAPDHRKFEGKVYLVGPSGISIISDIDDTVKITHVTDHAKMFKATFYDDFVVAPGMVPLYQSWIDRGASVHFVSSSPWQLYQPLFDFLTTAGVSAFTVSLKHVRAKDRTILNLFKSGEETKPLQIAPILQAYPNRKFVLVGDSGERDPETYAQLWRQHPEQIVRVYIRNVTLESADSVRFNTVFKDLDQTRWRLFDDPTELELPPI